MRPVRPWHAGLVLWALVCGCEDMKPAASRLEPPSVTGTPATPPASPPPKPIPARADAFDGGGDLTPDSGPSGAMDASDPSLSRDRRFALRLSEGDRIRYVDIDEVATHKRLTRIPFDKRLVVRSTGARARWTAGDNILLTWSAGSDVSNALVYSKEGKVLLQASGPALEPSPAMRYLVTYPTLFAAPPLIDVYDLSTGHKVARETAKDNTFWVVDSLEWNAQQLVAHCRDTQGQVQEVRIQLDAPP